MEATVKKTKMDHFVELKEIVEGLEDEAQKADLVEFIDKQIEVLKNRKKAAAARAEKKKAESDALTDEIYETLTEELVTVDAIVEAIGNEEVTRNKVTARLGKLVKAGSVVKEAIKVDGNRRMAYRVATEADAEADAEVEA